MPCLSQVIFGALPFSTCVPIYDQLRNVSYFCLAFVPNVVVLFKQLLLLMFIHLIYLYTAHICQLTIGFAKANKFC